MRARRANGNFDYFKLENGTNLPLPYPTVNPTPEPRANQETQQIRHEIIGAAIVVAVTVAGSGLLI